MARTWGWNFGNRAGRVLARYTDEQVAELIVEKVQQQCDRVWFEERGGRPFIFLHNRIDHPTHFWYFSTKED